MDEIESMNEKIIDNLTSVEKINLITAEVEKENFENLDICAPRDEDGKIYFLINSKNPHSTIYDQMGLYRKIKEILEYDEIILYNKNNFTEEDLNFYYDERCEFSEENIEKIKSLYQQDDIIEEEKTPYFNSQNTMFRSTEKGGERKRKPMSSSDSDIEESQTALKK